MFSLPSLISPTSGDISPPPSSPTLSSNPSTTSPSPTSSQPNQTTDPPPSSSPPPAVSTAPPPSPPLSPPPALTAPPPSTPASPPPSPPASPPPALPTSPPPSVPVILRSPPPPDNVPTPPSSKSPPSPSATPPESSSSDPAPTLTPPPSSSQAAPPAATTSPTTPALSPPPSVPSTSSPPIISSPETPSTPSVTGSPSSLPVIPTEKPIAKSTNGTNGSVNASKNGLSSVGAAGIGIVVGFIVLSLLVMAVWFVQKRKRKNARPKIGYTMPSPFASSQNSDSAFLRPQSPHKLVGGGPSGSYYSSDTGGFGCVYKGILTDGREVAVKQLKIGGGQGEREFRAEVEIISRVHHRHLVSLVGYCISEHQGRGRPVMDWALRVKVAAGAARGIAYLHEDCHPRIIHRDIKSSNILLDNNFEAQCFTNTVSSAVNSRHSALILEFTIVSDFGLAKLALDSNTHLITGRKPVDDSQPLGDESLVEWVKATTPLCLGSKAGKALCRFEMFRMIEAAAACVRHSAAKRPKMSQVVRALDSLDESSDLTNGMKPGKARAVGGVETAAVKVVGRVEITGIQVAAGVKNRGIGTFLNAMNAPM
ncbi:Proline-rich receptor-like protein kinase PERK12 [Hibiscus syriacus]|uniref:non-specific serine/threonine protein kinase n=1 Tax=Hibiscus syriacus TaxID=106335 RepID=A0A6A2WAR1_HIBSY|nr:Proline-rich receptor-like protein kinase PERK12 [Hibiscus syriacus]